MAEMVALCRRGPDHRRGSSTVDEEPAEPDALNLREPGERFSVLPTIWAGLNALCCVRRFGPP